MMVEEEDPVFPGGEEVFIYPSPHAENGFSRRRPALPCHPSGRNITGKSTHSTVQLAQVSMLAQQSIESGRQCMNGHTGRKSSAEKETAKPSREVCRLSRSTHRTAKKTIPCRQQPREVEEAAIAPHASPYIETSTRSMGA